MEKKLDFCYDKEFVSESFEKHDDVVDENDNYKCIEQTNVEQPVDAASVNLVIGEKTLELDDVLPNQKQNARQRQTTLSEYFFTLATETQAVKLERDDVSEKMVDQYFSASPTGTATAVKLEREEEINEHFSASPTRTGSVKLEQVDTSEKLVNVSLLLRQLLSARVVIERLPENSTPVNFPSKTVKLQKRTCEIGVQRYCHKCKTLTVDYNKVTTGKTCPECHTALLYVCDKCNESHYHGYELIRRHRARCEGVITGRSLDDIVMMYCAECPYETSHPIGMERHVKRTSHKVLSGEKIGSHSRMDNRMKSTSHQVAMERHAKSTSRKVLGGKKIVNRSKMNNRVKNMTSRVSSYQSRFIVKQNLLDLSKMKKRYCPTCATTVAGCTSSREETCKICHTTLVFQCRKCDQRYAKYSSMRYHLRTMCYPSLYRCTECKFAANYWGKMYNHLKKCGLSSWMPRSKRKNRKSLKRNDASGKTRENRKLSRKSYVKNKFTCEHCLFVTKYMRSLKRHVKTLHRELFA